MAQGDVNGSETQEPQPVGRKRGGYRYSEGPLLATEAVAPAQSWTLPLNWQAIWIALIVTAICVGMLHPWALRQLVDRWSSDSGWSHGFVVPLISLYFIWLKWDILKALPPRRSLFGLVVLLVGVTGEVLFRATGLQHMSVLSMLVVMMGMVLFVFGWEFMKLLWLPFSYLVFAIPPPQPLYVAMTTPMQLLAAECGVILLPLFGLTGIRHGTTIDMISGAHVSKMDVAQACSGMKMLVAFFALAVALGYSTNRPTWQKVFLALCALPIAIICNAVRVTLTGVILVKVNQEWASGKPHEFLGMLMLGPAMLMQLCVAWILDRIFVEVPESGAAEGGIK